MPKITPQPTKFQPSRWHTCKKDDWDCTDGVNCYAYILDNPGYHWAVPGFGYTKESTKTYFDKFRKQFNNYSEQEFWDAITEGAQQDGLTKIDEPEDREGFRLAALVFMKKKTKYGHDFHWYRQDEDVTWSHKVGFMEPTQKDDEGQKIQDPRTAASRYYKKFGGFFLVPQEGVTLKPGFPASKSKNS